ITEPGIVFKGEGFHVRAFPLRHTKPCYGYTLEEEMRPGEFHPEKAEALGVPRGPLWSKLQAGEAVEAAGGATVQPGDVLGSPRMGRKFSFVTDTLGFPEIAPQVADSDLLICEGMFTRDLLDSARDKKHMTAEQAARIALAAKVRKLALIHYSPRYTDYDLKQLLKEAQDIFPDTVLTRDRMVFPIEFRE
ncbi:MAG: ribonuclease Z, partial [Treponema sp.]|nr:ribonuclease Z [Treponema sp.]